MTKAGSVQSQVAARCRRAAIVLWSSLILVAVLLLSRRWADGILPPNSVWPLIFVSSMSSLFSCLGWVLFQIGHEAPSQEARVEMVAGRVAWLSSWLGGIALLPAESSLAFGWLLGIAFVSAGFFALTARRPQSLPTGEKVRDATVDVSDEASLSLFPRDQEEASGAVVTQWMTRKTLAEGVENIAGAVRVPFAAGQRSASIHVPFSPPFATVPQVECEVISEESARWKVSVVYAYGMRIELKRDDSREAAEIELAYEAICESASEAA
jgi:hypothetical protein